MLFLSNIMIGLGQMVSHITTFLMWSIIIHAVLSWVNPDPNNIIVRMLNNLVDPVLSPIRRKIPLFGGLDISPIIAVLFLKLIGFAVGSTLIEMGYSWKANSVPVTVN